MQVAPLLLAGPRAAEAQQYQNANSQFALGKGSGVIGQISQLVPGQAGQQLQSGVKTVGHKLANFLARV